MKTHAIFIMAYSRPNYLYVCLDSIRHCRGVEDWDIWVSFDNGPKAISHWSCREIMPFQSITRPKALGNRDHPTEILRCARYFSYEKMLFVEDDMLFGPDLLTWVRSQEEGWSGTISTLQHNDGSSSGVGHHSASPALLQSSHMDSLIKFMDTKAFLGHPNCINGEPITDVPHITYDVCWWDWYTVTQTKTRYSPRQHCFNFGFNGMHYNNARFDSMAFAGPSSSWLSNVLALSRNPAFSTLTRTHGFIAS